MTDPHDTATAELPTPAGGPAMRMLAIDSIERSLTNPRKKFDPVKLQSLADSIKASGVNQPVLVRPLPASRLQETFAARRKGTPLPEYELIAGERRLRASIMAGKTDIPALIRNMTDAEALAFQLVENLEREDLTEWEEAVGIQELMQHVGLTAAQVGEMINMSRSHVFNRLKLLDLCQEVREKLSSGTLDATKALLLARIPDHSLQVEAMKAISETNYEGDQSMGYRAAAAHVRRNYMLDLAKAKFPIADITLVPKAGACQACPKRTGYAPDIFADVPSADLCTDPKCFHGKEQALADRTLRLAHERGQTIIEGREAKSLMPNSYSPVEGYLRLDVAQDSPTDKPLRSLIGDQMERLGMQPVLVANPHKEGELIAVVTAAQATELLQAQGQADEAASIGKSEEQLAAQNSRQEQGKAKRLYEEKWRWNVLTESWAHLEMEGDTDVTDGLLRHVALRYAKALSTDPAKRLCKLLDLGKVAPVQGVIDYVTQTDNPTNALKLLVMFADVDYREYSADPDANPGLLLVAGECDVDIAAIKAATKKTMRDADKTLAARAKEGAGGTGEKTETSTVKKSAGTPGRRKASAEETMSGIAQAMQGLEAAAPAAAKPVMYRNPATGETWSGRGKKPKWLFVRLEEGKTLNDYLVENVSTAEGATPGDATALQGIEASALADAGTSTGVDTCGTAAAMYPEGQTTSSPVATASATPQSDQMVAPAFKLGDIIKVVAGTRAKRWKGAKGKVTALLMGGAEIRVLMIEKGRTKGAHASFAPAEIEVTK